MGTPRWREPMGTRASLPNAPTLVLNELNQKGQGTYQ